MKRNKLSIIFLVLGFSLGLISCSDDFLERPPLSNITPEQYLWEESQLAAFAVNQYGVLPTHDNYTYGTFGIDMHTDNMANQDYSTLYAPGEWKVPQSGGSWSFNNIYQFNYFLNTVLPRLRAGKLTGNPTNINHYIGEVYFLRAFEYFEKVKALGDFPIVKKNYPDDKSILIEASQRKPHSEVIRFVLTDLDSSIMLMSDASPDGKRNRLSKKVAQLFKSRVALYEATWLKYFKGTAFVPNGTGWPGADKDYNKGYQYASGSIDSEISWLLGEAMSAASAVADNVALVPNNGVLQQTTTDVANQYLDMFGSVDMSGYKEVLLWRKYDRGLAITHNVPFASAFANYSNGTTKGMVESFLMANGLPIYDPMSGYQGDDYLANVRKNRDQRLWLFLKEPGQKNLIFNTNIGTHSNPVELYPDLPEPTNTRSNTTGYALRKGINYDGNQFDNGQASTGCIVFRGVEAYLNYMEACFEKDGSLDAKANQYWAAIRNRAGVDADYNKTIAATDMSKEATGDWGAYSKGGLIDPTLYNIRRERRCELMAEGFRAMDLKRWRAMDQMINTPYHIEGFKLWGPMQNWYKDAAGKWKITWGTSSASVSPPERSLYIRPYEITGKELVYNGYKWNMAHYLSPIAIQHFLITSNSNDAATSPIYQNPGWPTTANLGPM